LMIRFFETVDANNLSPISNKIGMEWFKKDVIIQSFRASANFIFLVKTPDSIYFLRTNHESERSVKTYESELEFILHLDRQGINVVKPISSLAGNYTETTFTDMGIFHSVLFEAAPGRHWEVEEIDTKGFELWGKALGETHAASGLFKPMRRPNWQDHIELCREYLSPKTDQNALEDLKFIEDSLGTLPTNPEEFGLIHFDFELDNIRWQDNTPGIIDFDDCSFFWYEADIAFAIRDLFDDSSANIDLNNPNLRAFLNGYKSKKKISDQAIERLPLFLRFHNIITLSKLIRSIAEEPLENEPEWARGLRKKLENKMEIYRHDFQEHPMGRSA